MVAGKRYDPNKKRRLTGIEAVIDKDLASGLLAEELEADLFVIATDVDGVYLDWGKPEPPSGSLKRPASALPLAPSLHDIEKIVAGEAGTIVCP